VLPRPSSTGWAWEPTREANGLGSRAEGGVHAESEIRSRVQNLAGSSQGRGKGRGVWAHVAERASDPDLPLLREGSEFPARGGRLGPLFGLRSIRLTGSSRPMRFGVIRRSSASRVASERMPCQVRPTWRAGVWCGGLPDRLVATPALAARAFPWGERSSSRRACLTASGLREPILHPGRLPPPPCCRQ